MQTKDLKNDILILDDNVVNTTVNNVTESTTNQTTSMTNASIKTTTTVKTTTTTFEPTSIDPLQSKSDNKNEFEYVNSTIINIKTVKYSSEIPTSPIVNSVNDDDTIINPNYTNENDTNKNNNQTNIIQRPDSLPTPIVPKQTIIIQRTPLRKINRPLNGKGSSVRAALRLAAIEGLKAMNDLYERKEPNLIRKGE